MNWIRQIDSKYGPSGWLMALAASVYFCLLLTLAFSKETYTAILPNLAMPVSGAEFSSKPWTLLTYWLGNPAPEFWSLFVSLSLIYSFGTQLQHQIGRKRFSLALFAALFSIPVLALIAINLLPTVEQVNSALLFGLFPVGIFLVALTTFLTPNQPVRILSLEFRMLWMGIVLMALPLIGFRAIFTSMGTATLIAILFGLGWGLALKKLGKPVRWKSAIQNRPVPTSPKERVRVQEKQANPQHKGKFTVVHSQLRMTREEELNKLLDRINEVGYAGLTQTEKKRLEELSNG